MAIRVTRSDPRYALLQRSRNLRWDGNAADAVAEIELCETAEQAAEAAAVPLAGEHADVQRRELVDQRRGDRHRRKRRTR